MMFPVNKYRYHTGIRICIFEKHNAHGIKDHDLYMFDPNMVNYTLFVVVDLCLLWLYYGC